MAVADGSQVVCTGAVPFGEVQVGQVACNSKDVVRRINMSVNTKYDFHYHVGKILPLIVCFTSC